MSVTDNPRQAIFWIAVAALIVVAFYQLRTILAPFVAAGILAYALAPAVDRLQRWHVSRSLAASIVMLTTVLTIIAIVLILLPVLQSQIGLIRAQLPALAATLSNQFAPWLEQTFGIKLSLDTASIRNWLAAQLSGGSQDLLTTLLERVRTSWTAALGVILFIILVPVVLFYLLADWPHFTARVRELIPRRWAEQSNAAMNETDALLSQYLRGQLLVMLALAGWYSVGLLVAGLDQWLSLGVLTGLLAFIPYLGWGFSLLVSILLALLQLGISGLLGVVVVYGIGKILDVYILTPRMVGERIGLHPVAVLFALSAFGTLFGFTGMLLALPLAAIASVVIRRLHRAWVASSFYLHR